MKTSTKMMSVDSPVPAKDNPRVHAEKQIEQIAASIREFGFNGTIVVTPDMEILAGHGRLAAAKLVGLKQVPVMTVEGLTPAAIKKFRVADNKLGLNATWDAVVLDSMIAEMRASDEDIAVLGFTDQDLLRVKDDADAIREGGTEGLTDPNAVPDVPEDPKTKLGDVWLLGRHQIRCGTSSDDAAPEFFVGVDLVLTDPPYSSGGFQEAGRAAGSVGTGAAHKKIINDRLSSRGFGSLMKAAVFSVQAPFFYVFTDWRMWVYLFDVAEASGAGVRNMITWNKGTPGMGRGWRSQQELVMWATRKSPPYPKGFPGIGNVISMPRQKNELHTTQKPVELIRTLLQGAPFARTVADPFLGSGTTLIACEMEGRECIGCELDPAYVDVAVNRWENFTGAKATRLE